jgi:hypothetical protein
VEEILEKFNTDNETVFNYEWSFKLDGAVIIDSFGYDEILLKSRIYKIYNPTLSLAFIRFNHDEIIPITKIKEFMKMNQNNYNTKYNKY